VSSVSSSSSLDGSLDANVGDLALLGVKTLGFSVGLNVLEEVNNMFDRFLWESTVEEVNIFAHCFSGNTIVVSSEWDDGLVLKDSFEVLESFMQVHASQGSGSLVSVLVVNSQIISSAGGS